MTAPVDVHVNVIDGKVIVTFSQPITFISMDVPQTEEIIRLLQEQLDQLKRTRKLS